MKGFIKSEYVYINKSQFHLVTYINCYKQTIVTSIGIFKMTENYFSFLGSRLTNCSEDLLYDVNSMLSNCEHQRQQMKLHGCCIHKEKLLF